MNLSLKSFGTLKSLFWRTGRPSRRSGGFGGALAALAVISHLGAAHATYPGENGVIVFRNPYSNMIGRVAPTAGAPVTYLREGYSPAVAPNGRKIAFAWLGGLYVMDIDGSNLVQLAAEVPLHDPSPTWLPDGSRVVYQKNITQGSSYLVELWSVKPDGTGKTLMSRLPYQDVSSWFLEWAPSSSFALMSLYFAGGQGSFSTFLIAPALPVRPVFFKSNNYYPSWAPDGRSILLQDKATGLWEEDYLDGTRRFSPAVNGVVSSPQSISPDGAFIAASVQPEAGAAANLQTRPRAGGNPLLTWPQHPSTSVNWSRVPRNCHETTPGGGGGVLANEVDLYVEQCAVAVMPDLGRMTGGVLMQAVAIGTDGRVYHRTLVANAMGGAPTWTAFAVVPGIGGSTGGVQAKKVAIAGAGDGSSQVIIVGLDDTVYHTVRTGNGLWQSGGFQLLDGPGSSTFLARDVAISIDGSTTSSPGNAQVIANGLGVGAVYHRIRDRNGNWSGFGQVPGSQGLDTRELAITADAAGNSLVLSVTRADNGAVQLLRQVHYANGAWDSGFVPVKLQDGVTLPATADVALTLTAGGNAQVLYTDGDRTWFQERTSPLSSLSWITGVPNILVAPAGSRTVSISAQPTSTGTSEILLVRTSAQ